MQIVALTYGLKLLIDFDIIAGPSGLALISLQKVDSVNSKKRDS